MRDKTIIKTISAIYFSIVSFFVFIFLTLIFSSVVLKNGLYLDEISFPNLKVKQLYIKWNEKIDFSIEEIAISKKSKSQEKIDTKKIETYLNNLFVVSNLFQSVTIEKIHFNEINASFKYRKNENGFLLASSSDFTLEAQIYFQEKYLNIDIKHFKDAKKKITAKGALHLNLNTHEITSKLFLNINNDIKINTYLAITQEKLQYKIENLKNITNLQHTIDLIQLPKEVRYWALDAIQMQELKIASFHGYVDFNNTKDALKNIYISATIHKLDYTYNPTLDAIHTAYTELEFKNGILYIRPKEAYSYGQFLDKSWLKIDFTQKEELLTLHLLFNGIVDKNMLHILNTYKIKLPFLQNTGEAITNLTIEVGLRNIDIDAKGDFFVKKGNFTYLGLDVDIYDLKVQLDNYDVYIKNMHTAYKDIASADVDVNYNAKTSTGKIFFRAKKIQASSLHLQTKEKPLNITYNIQKGLDFIEVEHSTWMILDKTLSVEPITMLFDLEKLNLTLPTTYMQLENIASAYVTGSIDLKHMIVDLNTDLLSFKYSQIRLDQSNTQIKIHYDKKLSILSKDEMVFDLDGTMLTTSHVLVEILDDVIDIKHTKINVGNYLTASINARYDEKKKIERVRVKNLKIKDKDTLLYKKSRLVLNIQNTKDELIIQSKEIDAILNISKKQWQLNLNSLKNISRGSKQLKQLSMTDGTLSLTKTSQDQAVYFNADIIYPYRVLLKDDKYITNYKVQGKIEKKDINFNINNIVDVNIKEDVRINIKDAGINIDEIIKMVYSINTQTSNSKAKNLTLEAKNSFLDFGNNRKAISDTITLQYFDKILTAQLKHKKGIAGFRLDKNKFHLYGKDFGDLFMEKLFTLSKFKDGSLKFSMSGTLNQYDGVFYINDTIVVDYVIMNNLLAFVNTIPSLATFSIPGYNRNGLLVDEAYMKFTSKDGHFDISDLYLESKEISISGNGDADINKDTVNIDLTLKTDLGSSTSKIPVVGYIVLGKDNISTGVNVSGKLSDPKVKSLIMRDIVVAPLNIIKRTLLFPYKLLQDLNTDKNSSK